MPPFNPSPFMVHLLKTIGFDHDTTPTHPVFLALQNGGYLHPPDLFNLNEEETSRMEFTDTSVQPMVTMALNRGYQVRLLALRAFRDDFEDRELRRMNVTDWATVDSDAMDDFIMQGTVLANPTPIVAPILAPNPVPASSASTRNSAIESFRKTIRRDPTHFSTFNDRNKWASWQLAFEATARAQDMQEILDAAYVPVTNDDREVFQAKQQYMYAVFVRTLLTDEGKTLVRKHMTGYNAQLIYKELVEYYNKSIHSEIKSGSILGFLSSFRLGQSAWAGNDTNSFLNFYMEQMRRYDEISRSAGASPMHDVHKIQLLDAAVQGIDDLRQVRTTYQTMCLTNGQSSQFQAYFDLLHNASMVYDNKQRQARTNSRGGTSRDRKVYATQSNYEEGYLDNPDDYHTYDYEATYDTYEDDLQHFDVNVDTPLSTITIFAAEQERRAMFKGTGARPPNRFSDPAVRLPDHLFTKLSREEKEAWFKFSPETRRMILGANARLSTQPGTSRGPPRPHNGISSVDRKVLLAETQPNSTSEDLAPDPGDQQASYSASNSTNAQATALTTFPGDLRRVLSTSAARNGDSAVKINKTLTYTIKNAHVQGCPIGALIDRGANGGLAGADCRVLAVNSDSFVNIEGIDRHQVTNVPLVSCGAYAVSKNHGPVILIFHQLAGLQKGPTILSAAQLEAYYNNVNEKSLLFDPKGQLITTNDGFEFPLGIRNGLAYLDMRPFTDDEWNTYPHVVMTSDVNWDPSSVDGEFPLSGDEPQRTADDYDNETPFSPFGNYLKGTIVASSRVLHDQPTLVETATPTDVMDDVDAAF